MRNCLALAAALSALAGAASSQQQQAFSIPGAPPVRAHGPLATVRELLAAEHAFEAQSIAAGPAKAMRDHMDAIDGLSFSGGEPARGAQAIFKAQGGDGPHGTLTWTPAEVFAAQAGDMGAVWGHFRYVGAQPTIPTVTGEYVTVWRKSADGQWKGVIDIGTPDGS